MGALDRGPEALDPVRVDIAPDVLTPRVGNGLVVDAIPDVGARPVRVDRRALVRVSLWWRTSTVIRFASRSFTPATIDLPIPPRLLFSQALPERDSERVGWDMLRRICVQLQVPIQKLDIPGLHLE